MDALDRAMQPSTEDKLLHRGIPDTKEVFGTDTASKITGTQVDNKGYTSVSEQKSVAEEFAGGIAFPGDTPSVISIRVPRGTPMLRIPAGDYGDQDEWLLPRDIRVAVGDAAKRSDSYGFLTNWFTSTLLRKSSNAR